MFHTSLCPFFEQLFAELRKSYLESILKSNVFTQQVVSFPIKLGGMEPAAQALRGKVIPKVKPKKGGHRGVSHPDAPLFSIISPFAE